MWKPDRRLDDFIVRPETELTLEPPSDVLLRPTSEIEILQPLSTTTSPPNLHLWFRRLVVAGSGAIVFMASVLISAILVGIGEPAGSDLARAGQYDDYLMHADAPLGSDVPFPPSVSPVTGGVYVVLSKIKPTPPRRPRVRTVVYKPRRQYVSPSPHPLQVANFIPTTLVIYPENGVINTRIEPWVQ